ncbi:MAG: hypothetical protein PUK40_05405 [Actinomycetaceae bacterium]|nr:hypothetical protein [Arcanobacterium sp.]MDD7505366.1 hypothetical protein [Actinomycetaceae bacterium]MDY6142749.1 hypothetical protein [Arcanobacterium sp.]
MDDFGLLVSLSVRRFGESRGLSLRGLSSVLGYSYPTLVSKLNASRRWTVADLQRLADAGVALPPLRSDVRRVKP